MEAEGEQQDRGLTIAQRVIFFVSLLFFLTGGTIVALGYLLAAGEPGSSYLRPWDQIEFSRQIQTGLVVSGCSLLFGVLGFLVFRRRINYWVASGILIVGISMVGLGVTAYANHRSSQRIIESLEVRVDPAVMETCFRMSGVTNSGRAWWAALEAGGSNAQLSRLELEWLENARQLFEAASRSGNYVLITNADAYRTQLEAVFASDPFRDGDEMAQRSRAVEAAAKAIQTECDRVG